MNNDLQNNAPFDATYDRQKAMTKNVSRRTFIGWAVAVVAGLVAACGERLGLAPTATPGPAPAVSPTPTLPPTWTPAPTDTPQPTATPVVPPTEVPAATAVPTDTPAPTAAPVTVSSLGGGLKFSRRLLAPCDFRNMCSSLPCSSKSLVAASH